MKQKCQNDFHCTFQHWLGSCRCASPPHARASQKPRGQTECSMSEVRFSCTGVLMGEKKRTESNSDMCARRRLHPGVCFATVQSCQRFSWDFNCVIFNFGLPLLPTQAVAWSFGWCQEIPFSILSLKGCSTWGLGARQGLLFMCFCLYIKDGKGVSVTRERVAHKVCPSRVLYPYLSVCVEGIGQCERQWWGWTCLMYCDNSVRYVAFMGTPCPGDMGEWAPV